MDKRFWAVVAAIMVIFVGIVVVNNRNKDDSSSGAKNNSSASATNHAKGDNAKNVTLVEYGDFQCPVCSVYEPTIQEVVKKYEKDIKFQFRHFPLQQIHANAFAASRAAEAASKQGKFWEMHDQLYLNQNAWSSAGDPVSTFTQYAKTIGISPEQFKTDFNSKAVNDAVNADIAAGNKLKVSGTPTFYLNGKELELKELVGSDNSPSVDKFSKLIDEAIGKEDAKQPAAADESGN
jgi:protein-disulfide isomerase